MVHFRPDEHAFVERAWDWVDRAVNRSQPITTFFLNPREQYILETFVRRESELIWMLNGGYESAERCRMVISPTYISIQPDWFQLGFLRIEPIGKGSLDHPDVLGALLGLGIKREMLGDLHPHPTGCDCVVAKEMVDYICAQLHQVGKNKVSIKEISAHELYVSKQEYQTRTVIVSSLRLDALLAEGHSFSRSKAVTLVKSGRCKVNWKQVENPSYQVEVGDMISLRGFGRIRIKSIEGLTKKGRNIILLDYLI
ncbi:RNA-binding protein YlmH, contains S4-like domain [Thermoflavimicrobium dichotomicum]|uniref:RNA-binding protein YlmH, contains S4-like domain n=1 Tax=Thermoflavimicrobium dichotomicum TaxID=46223 RepID=A0A1I3V9Q3_9BACL|nr:RNA-binding protein YlmH, contains S4-like domain [Thermoflavimicrobium dichotomicum]